MKSNRSKGVTSSLSSQIIQERHTSDFFYKHIAELTPDAVVVHSDGKILYANPATVKLIEAKKAEELIGKPVMKFIHKDSIPLIQERIKHMLTKSKVAPFVEEKFITLKGNILHAETKAVPFRFQGKPAILAILRDVTARKKNEKKQNFLSEVSMILGSSVSFHTTLNNICKLLVPYLADYIRIALVTDANTVEEVAAYHRNPRKLALVEKLYKTYSERSDVMYGVSHIVHSGKAEIIKNVTSNYTVGLKNNKEMLRTIDQLGLTSYMGVPLKVNKRVVGVITFSSSSKDRMYTEDDLEFAKEVAVRIAYAVENAKLFNNLQKELQEKVSAQEGQSRLAAIVNSSDDAIISKNLDSVIQTWNQAAEKMFGYTSKEAIGKKVYLIIPKERYYEEEKIIATLKQGKRIKHFQTVRQAKDGRKIDVSLTISPILDDKGHVIGASKIARDITEEIRLQNNLRFFSEASKLLSSSLDYKTTLANITKLAVPHIADWCAVDMKTEKGIEQLAVAHVDPKKVKWAQELRRKNPPDPHSKTGVPHVLRTGKAEYYYEVRDEMLAAAAKNEEQLTLLRKLKFSSIIIVPIRVKGETVGAITFVSAESGHHYSRTDLAIAEELSARAGIAIESALLYSQAQRAIKVRDEFISLASHELKTPLSSIKMYGQILNRQLEKKGDTALLNFLNKIDQQTNRLTLLVNDLLNVSKIQHGKLEYKFENVDLNTLVDDIVDVMRQVSLKHTIIVKGEIKQSVKADPFRIYQVLTNLLTNAIKYSPDANKIFVNLSSDNEVIKITVQDFGIGIAPDHQEKIFDQFYRVIEPNERKFTGLGMGLFISHEIIKRHGGKMSVKSVKGKGSQFTFTLPSVTR